MLAVAACKPSHETGDRESQLAPGGKSSAPERGPHGEVIVHLAKEAQEKMGLALAAPARLSMKPEVVAYGRVIADPSASFTVRAPIAGTIVASSSPWPSIGAEITVSARIGSIKPRLTAVERGDIATRLAASRGDLEASRASIAAARAGLERTRALNAENKNASDRALQEAEARVKAEEARGAAAQAAIDTLRPLLEPDSESKASVAIPLARDGTVVEVLAHPGEAVDAGAVLVRIENLDRLQARVDMPVEASERVGADTIRIAAVGDDAQSFTARRVATVASVDAANQGGSMLYAIDASFAAQHTPLAQRLRPGQAIVARLPKSDVALDGFVIPRAAVLRFTGKSWVYDATGDPGDDSFTRRSIELDTPVEQGWFVTASWAANAHVVVVGASELLSEEILGTQSKHGEEP